MKDCKKDNKKNRKLALNKETVRNLGTLRHLNHQDLGQVAGGRNSDWCSKHIIDCTTASRWPIC